MGSDSDLEIMKAAAEVLDDFDIAYEMTVASAHRSPQRAAEFATSAPQKGMRVIIAGAGHAAHLAGVLAAHTSLPIIGVPIDSSCLQGLDSLLATVQMPPGIPAVQILATSDPQLSEKLRHFKQDMARQVEQKAKKLETL
jgi:phosphoribosylamine--glycine ligase